MKQRICNWARRRLPLGLEPEGELKLMAGSLAVMALISAVGFSGRLESGIQALYRVLGQDRKVLWPEARMIPFYQLLPETAVFFAAVALAFGLWLGLWLYCRQESRADYRLRLLPDRWEFFRRTASLPLLYLALAALTAALMVLLHYLLYLARVPEKCLEPDQWGLFLDALLGRRH